MATPQNPLDIFVTYTTHYELHAAPTIADLEYLVYSDEQKGFAKHTTNRYGSGTLLINTRTDAHQHIDDIQFFYNGPNVDPSNSMQPVGDVTMVVTEPNGTFFAEKIENQAKLYNVTDITSSLVFGLKIIFVGRLEDGSEHTMFCDKVICLTLVTISADFTFKGGVYNLHFSVHNSVAASSPLSPNNSLAKSLAYIQKNIFVKSRTVQDALKQLESKLNGNYKSTYETDLKNCIGAREIRYVIEVDPRINGNLNIVNGDEIKTGEEKYIPLNANTDIGFMIKTILLSSKQVIDMIAESSKSINQPFEPGIKIPVIEGIYNLTDEYAEVRYKITLYEGGEKDDNKIEFNYFFSGAGQNVDVLDFSIKFQDIRLWMQRRLDSTSQNVDRTNEVEKTNPGYYSSNIVHKDITRDKIYNVPKNQKCVPVSKGDVVKLPAIPPAERTGLIKLDASAAGSARLAFETYTQMNSSSNPLLEFTIRGHFDILNKAVSFPGTANKPYISPLGVSEGFWVKVNIFNSDGTPFFYTSWYKLISVVSNFRGGQFTQTLKVQMMSSK